MDAQRGEAALPRPHSRGEAEEGTELLDEGEERASYRNRHRHTN